MFFLLAKEEGSSTASAKRYKMTSAAAGYMESEEKARV